MRTIKELLVILKEQVETMEVRVFTGLCKTNEMTLRKRVFNPNEYQIVHAYLMKNSPGLLRQAMISYKHMDRVDRKVGYWWKEGEIKPRLKWLDKQINSLS